MASPRARSTQPGGGVMLKPSGSWYAGFFSALQAGSHKTSVASSGSFLISAALEIARVDDLAAIPRRQRLKHRERDPRPHRPNRAVHEEHVADARMRRE